MQWLWKAGAPSLTLEPSAAGGQASMSEEGLRKLAYVLLVILILYVSIAGGV
ncbi:MAG: hypothetical protein Kow0058_15960 [Roseovarius sp.]